MPDILRFYIRVLKFFAKSLYPTIRTTEERWSLVGWLLSIAFGLFAYSTEVDPRWALVPLGIMVLIALIRAIYQTAVEHNWARDVLPRIRLLKGHASFEPSQQWSVSITLNAVPKDSPATFHTARFEAVLLVSGERRDCELNEFKGIPEALGNSKFHIRVDRSCRVVIGMTDDLHKTRFGENAPPHEPVVDRGGVDKIPQPVVDRLALEFRMGCDENDNRCVFGVIRFRQHDMTRWDAVVSESEINEVDWSWSNQGRRWSRERTPLIRGQS